MSEPTPVAGRPEDPTTEADHGPVVGSFRFWFLSRRWDWSPEVYTMHGYTPGEVEPTTELLLSHKHPDDRDRVAEAILGSLHEERPFSSRHRIIDITGRVRQVMLVSDRILDATGRAVGTSGFYIDLDATLAAAERDTLDAVMPEVVAARAAIEQAKGVLMRTYRISADQAFQLLKWRSQETNIKLRDLAEALLIALPELPPAAPDTVAAFDHLLLTVHQRLGPGNG
ncbi:PAS and ANTAR domain-containing protein [Nocardia sp. NPDC050406]|uniref:PAS and ANTAR domain-containing protein n=1 Tax=Nocardia sp. NPDC050406 TaxID=3364318 RepID=UPI00378F3054